MKKIFAAAFVILALAGRAHAQIEPAQSVKFVMPTGVDCSSMTIGTTAVEVTGNTSVVSTSAKVRYIAILNLSSTNNVYCRKLSTVASSGNLIGWPIVNYSGSGAYNWMGWTISTMQQWWCVAAGANTSIMVCPGS